MKTLANINTQDLRPHLSVIDRPNCRRVRNGRVTSVTLHYNGPAVSAFGKPKGELKHVVEVDVPNHQERLNSDSLMYHFVVLSDGAIWQTRDLDLQAWHCRNADGNEHSIAVHLPLGGLQDATAAQWSATSSLFEALIAGYGLSGRQAVKGHLEWSPSACPGPYLMSRLRTWRSGQADKQHEGGVFRVRDDIGIASVREGAGRSFPVALGGKAMMYPGDTLYADTVVAGELIGQEARWAHRADALGFVHLSLLDALVEP